MPESKETSIELHRAGLDAARGGDLLAAMEFLRRARTLAPQSIAILVDLGDVLRRSGQWDKARALLEHGKSLAPRDAALAYHLGQVYRALRQFSPARRELELALEQAPTFSVCREALILVEIAERDYETAARHADAAPGGVAAQSAFHELICVEAIARGDAAAARAYGEIAFARHPSPGAAMALARAEYGDGAVESAEARLDWILIQPATGDGVRARAIGTLADIADRRGDYAKAFQHYAASKRLLKDIYTRAEGGKARSFLDLTRRLAGLTAQRADTPLPANSGISAQTDRQHIFLLGFPRTGTTLIEQCLAGHPDIVTSDESGALAGTLAPLLDTANPFARLSEAPDRELQGLREIYWREIGRQTSLGASRALVDKMPFNSIYIGFIPHLFPAAKIVFSVRDPRDVAFACFRRRFGMNDATAELCTLAGSVDLYCAVMQLAALSRAGLSTPIMDIRYEDTVRDLGGVLSQLCGFLEVEWRDDLVHFAERARNRPLSTVSAPQLVKGLYDGGGVWRRYRQFLEPHLPALAPWVARFGYPVD